jgi:hypothetical protein
MYGNPVLTAADLDRGTCAKADHPVTEAGHPVKEAIVYREYRPFCRACHTETVAALPPRTCRRGLHDLSKPNATDGSRRCRECRKVTQASARRVSGRHEHRPEVKARYAVREIDYSLRGTFPSLEVRSGAACSPRTAFLFEPRMYGESATEWAYRLSQAAALCGDCPVWQLCKQWAAEQRDPIMLAAL